MLVNQLSRFGYLAILSITVTPVIDKLANVLEQANKNDNDDAQVVEDVQSINYHIAYESPEVIPKVITQVISEVHQQADDGASHTIQVQAQTLVNHKWKVLEICQETEIFQLQRIVLFDELFLCLVGTVGTFIHNH